MSELRAARAIGKLFKFGKHRIRLHWRFIDISDGMNGRIRFFPWSKWFK